MWRDDSVDGSTNSSYRGPELHFSSKVTQPFRPSRALTLMQPSPTNTYNTNTYNLNTKINLLERNKKWKKCYNLECTKIYDPLNVVKRHKQASSNGTQHKWPLNIWNRHSNHSAVNTNDSCHKTTCCPSKSDTHAYKHVHTHSR